MNDDLLKRLEGLLEKATPGPWDVRRTTNSDFHMEISSPTWLELARFVTGFTGMEADDEAGMANIQLVAAARNHLPALLSDYKRMREALEAFEEEVIAELERLSDCTPAYIAEVLRDKWTARAALSPRSE